MAILRRQPPPVLPGASNAGEIIWLYCLLWTVPAARAIHLDATDRGEFITLVAGEQPSLLMAGNNDEAYDKKPQRYAEDNVTQW